MDSLRARATVIVVNWNGAHLLGDCLEGLRRQTWRDFRTVVVDNGSTDGSVAFLRSRYPWVEVLALAENTGFSVANNLALGRTESPYIALLNNDAVPEPAWLERLIDALERHPDAGSAASKMVSFQDPGIIDRAGDEYSRAGTAAMRGCGKPSRDYRREERVFGACAGAALYRASMLKDVGLFPEHFFLLYEDVDLSFRAQLRGHACLFVPNAVVRHRISSTIVRDSPQSVYYSHRNLEWVYVRNMPAGLIGKSLWRHLLYVMASFVFFLARGRGGSFLRAKRDALLGMRRAWRDRKIIQAGKTVDNRRVWALLSKDSFRERLETRRRKSHG